MVKLQQKTESTVDHSQPEDEDKSKRAFFVMIIIGVVYLVTKMALVIAVFAMIRSINLASLTSSNSYQRTQQNLQLWKEEIIVDFRVVSGYNCPSGYERYSAYNWSGTIEGCSCEVNIGIWDYTAVLQGRCNQKQFSKGCKSIPAYTSSPYLFWKPSTQLCVQRLQGYTFYSLFADIMNVNNYSQKECASGTDYEIDLISVIPCPITDIKNDSSLNQSIPQLGFSFTQQSNYPIAMFRIAEYQFCQDFNQDAVSPGRSSNYALENTLRWECNTSDVRTIIIDQQTEPSFFAANPQVYDVIKTLPAYPLPDDHFHYLLGFVRYPAWTYSCRSSGTYNLIYTTQYLSLTTITAWFNTSQILMTALLSLALFLVICYWIDAYLHLRAKHQHGYLFLKNYQIKKINPQSSLPRNRTTQILKFLFVQLFSVCALITLSIFHSLCSKAYNWFASASSCTDSLFQSYLLTYQQFFGSAMAIILASVFVVVGWILTDMSYLLWRICKGDLQQEVIQDLQMVDIRDVSSIVSNEKDGNIVSLTEECMIDNTHKIQGGAAKFSQPNNKDMELDFSMVSSSEYSSNSSSSPNQIE